MKLEEDPICNQCEEDDETAEHYLGECPAYGAIRQQTLGHIFLGQTELPTLKIKEILKYVRKTRRFEPP